jgi:diguanylate cyclase (GGDEF)-like protein
VLIRSSLLWGTVVIGLGILSWSIVSLVRGTDPRLALLVLSVAVVGELLKVTIYEAKRETLSFSLSVVVIMAAVTVDPPLGPAAAITAGLIHVLAIRQRAPIKIAFNLFNLVVAAGGASGGWVLLRGLDLPFGLGAIAAAGCAAVVYYVLNVGNTSAMISLHAGRPFWKLMRESIWFAPTSILLGLTGAFIGMIQGSLGLVGALMFTVPVLVMRFTLAFYARRSAATIRHLDHVARHDPLTGLANRIELQEKLQEQLTRADEAECALLMLDLDRFKEINDTFGHHHGDMLLQQIGPRLQAALSTSDLVVRLGGDEFAVLLSVGDGDRAAAVAENLLIALQTPFVVDGHRLEVGASIGLAVAPDDGNDPITLLRCADVAMYVAKRDRSGFARHTPDQDQHSPERLSLMGDLRLAIEQNQLTLHYQPKVDLRQGTTTSAEALVRWHHPEQGLIPPDKFIYLAEHAGLIKSLTRWVLEAALHQSREWQASGWNLSVAVNASAQDLRDERFPELVSNLLRRYGVAASRLRIEITEGAMMSDLGRTRAILEQVRALGVGVSVDDFGTGYSSLSYLKRLPVNELKIDRAFVRNIASDAEDLAIVRSTVDLAHSLGLTVVAEGAEDEAAVTLLAELGCDYVQGYVFSRPLPSDAFAEWMAGPYGQPSLVQEAA